MSGCRSEGFASSTDLDQDDPRHHPLMSRRAKIAPTPTAELRDRAHLCLGLEEEGGSAFLRRRLLGSRPGRAALDVRLDRMQAGPRRGCCRPWGRRAASDRFNALPPSIPPEGSAGTSGTVDGSCCGRTPPWTDPAGRGAGSAGGAGRGRSPSTAPPSTSASAGWRRTAARVKSALGEKGILGGPGA